MKILCRIGIILFLVLLTVMVFAHGNHKPNIPDCEHTCFHATKTCADECAENCRINPGKYCWNRCIMACIGVNRDCVEACD